MIESEWLSSTDPASMLEVVRKDRQRVKSGQGGDNYYVASDRKLRLFAVAVERAWWEAKPHEPEETEYRRYKTTSFDLAEKFADARFSYYSRIFRRIAFSYTIPEDAQEWATEALRFHNRKEDRPVQAALLREIVGNPFQPTLRHESLVLEELLTWNDGTVPRAAKSIYDRRAFEEMPVLADALEDAGCTDEAIMQHCRGMRLCIGCSKFEPAKRPTNCICRGTGFLPMDRPPAVGPHVRGCWVLDLLLGKE